MLNSASTYVPKDENDPIRCYPESYEAREILSIYGWDGPGWYFIDTSSGEIWLHGPFETYDLCVFCLTGK